MPDTFPAYPAPEFDYEMTVQPRVLATDAAAFQQRALDGINTLMRSTMLTFKEVDDAERDILLNFCVDHGGDVAFFWQPVDDDDPTLWITTGWSWGPNTLNSNDVTVSLSQEFDPLASAP